MSSFDPAFLIDEAVLGDHPADAVRSKISAWIKSSWFAELLETYGGRLPENATLDRELEYLEEFSDQWDFRRRAREQGATTDDQLTSGQGSARWLSSATGLSEGAEARIVTCASHLGLVEGRRPSLAHYDAILVLGGARLSCLLRARMAAELLGSGVRTETIALLGAARPVGDSERDATDTYAPGTIDEFDLAIAGAKQALGLNTSVFSDERDDHQSNKNLAWVVRHFEATPGSSLPLISAISAPSSDPDRRRANSADTILFFLDRAHVVAGKSLLLITSQIYVPYVQLEALRTVALRRQIRVETVGVPASQMPALQGLTNPNHYLQEVRSTIQSAHRFCDAFPAGL